MSALEKCWNGDSVIYSLSSSPVVEVTRFESPQDIPLHVCMITHLLIAWDRMRWLSDPLKCRLPAFVCSCATWLAGIVITLPYPIYINYMDLGVSRGREVYLSNDIQSALRGEVYFGSVQIYVFSGPASGS